jgi:hypothetical protein
MVVGASGGILGIDFDEASPHKTGTAPAGDSGAILFGRKGPKPLVDPVLEGCPSG